MRVTGTHHGDARRVDESQWLLLALGIANQEPTKLLNLFR